MDVTVENFEVASEQLKDAVKTADFVAFDLEFSGLSTRVQSYAQREMDKLQMAHNRHQINFARHRHSVSQLLILQFGCCPMQWDDAKKWYATITLLLHLLGICGPELGFFNVAVSSPVHSTLTSSQTIQLIRYLIAQPPRLSSFTKTSLILTRWLGKVFTSHSTHPNICLQVLINLTIVHEFSSFLFCIVFLLLFKGVPYLSHHDAEVLRNKAAQSTFIDLSAVEDKTFIHEHL
jgi:hypothetical protein